MKKQSIQSNNYYYYSQNKEAGFWYWRIVKDSKDLPTSSAVKSGFLVNVLNPKATLFLLAVFTQVIDPETPKFIQTLYGLEMVVATFVWFVLVSFVFSNKVMKQKISRFSHWIDRVGGAVMLALGIKVAVSTQK